MYKLRNQYRGLLYSLLAIAITAQYVIVKFVLEPGRIEATNPIAFFLTLSVFYSFIVIGPMFLYEKWIWKVANKELNISGHWSYTLSYNSATRSNADRKFLEELPNEGKLEIVQNPFVIRFNSGTESYVDHEENEVLASWYSTSADFITETQLVFSFEFRVGARLFAGVENVTLRLDKGKPARMHSQFVMYDQNSKKPFCFGEVYYTKLA